nr:MAG TPA: hypothetical protein [Caudoviricetes sp.]
MAAGSNTSSGRRSTVTGRSGSPSSPSSRAK